jgi:hypothetical protein
MADGRICEVEAIQEPLNKTYLNVKQQHVGRAKIFFSFQFDRAN